MSRFLASASLIAFLAAASCVGPLGLAACGDSASATGAGGADAAARRDGSAVEAPDAGPADAAVAPPPVPTCAKYCELVTKSCAGDQAQYASADECLAFCARFTEGKPGEDDTSTLACRAFYAGSPAKTDPGKYCAAAGPFGGGICGDRCTAFCQLSVAACDPDAGTMTTTPPYASYPDCATACAGYAFRDAGVDGGGESPSGPTSGDTLNCRLFELRQVIAHGVDCAYVGADSGACQ
jgi:hypothetical protein